MMAMNRSHNLVIVPDLSDLTEQLEIADNAEPDVEVECCSLKKGHLYVDEVILNTAEPL